MSKEETLFMPLAQTIGDMMYFTKLNDNTGLLLAVDFEKAFVSVSWRFLLKPSKK